MINIVTNRYKNISGPGKVVQNLIKGLRKLKYPYIINGSINSCLRTYIPNRRSALRLLANAKSKIIVGPNLYVMPKEIALKYDFSKCIYILPSEWNVILWHKVGFNLCPLKAWATGIDTDIFTPLAKETSDPKVLIYHKERKPSELEIIERALKKQRFDYRIIYYGRYRQEEYIKELQNTSFRTWHGRHESQGLALQEALAMDVPILVCDVKSVFDQYQVGYTYIWDEENRNIPATAAPYFDDSCGIKIQELTRIEEAMEFMLNNLKHFSPREFVLRNLSLEGQARKLIELYEYWGMSYENGFSEKLLSARKYSDPLFHQAISFGKNVLGKMVKWVY